MPTDSLVDDLWSQLVRSGRAIRPAEVSSQLAALIYLRWADLQESELQAAAEFEGRDFCPLLPSRLHWRTWHSFSKDELRAHLSERLPSELQRTLVRRQDPNAARLCLLVDTLRSFGQWPSVVLKQLVDWLAEQPFETPSDRHQLLCTFDSQWLEAGGHTSGYSEGQCEPTWLASLVAELANPIDSEMVYDPCFGYAQFLVEISELVNRQSKSVFRRGASQNLFVSGQEIDVRHFVVGMTRLMLAGVTDPWLGVGDSLERLLLGESSTNKYDVIVANPPWGTRVRSEVSKNFPIKTNDSTGLFIQHALASLKKSGRMVVVAPQGYLYRGGREQKLRESLLQKHSVDAVIGLPAGAILPYSSIATALLVVRNEGPTSEVRMVDAGQVIEPARAKTTVSKNAIQKLVDLVRSKEQSDAAWTVSVGELEMVDWDLTPKRRDLTELPDLIEKLGQHVRIATVSDTCDVIAGRHIREADLSDQPYGLSDDPAEVQRDLFLQEKTVKQGALFNESQIPYIRIGDIRKGSASQGTKWILPAALEKLRSRWRLKPGDLLISKSGTIGKSGIVRNGAVGGIAASGLIVLRTSHDLLDPHFLMAFLESGKCQAWLEARSRGAVMRHVSPRVLESLPIPIPSLQIQRRVSEEHRQHGVDALEYLSQLLLESESNVVAKWVDEVLAALQPRVTDSTANVGELLWPTFSGVGLVRVFQELSKETEVNDLTDWVLKLSDSVFPSLKRANGMPASPALLSLYQQCQSALEKAEKKVEGHLPHASRARELNRLLADYVDKAISRLFENVIVTFSSETNSLRRGGNTQVNVTVTNRGPLPLLGLKVEISPWIEDVDLGMLTENGTTMLHLEGETPDLEDSFSLRFDWRAESLEGAKVEGNSDLSFMLIDESGGSTDQTLIDSSPYVCGDPVTPKRSDVFMGRQDLLSQIRRQIGRSGNVVLLEGNRRSGKTSVLKHLVGKDAAPGWFGVYSSLQGAEGSKKGVGVPTAEVFRAFARDIAKGFHQLGDDTPLPNGETLAAGQKPFVISRSCKDGISEDSPFVDFMAYVEVILDSLARHDLRLVLMLDEFDKLQEGIDNGVTSPQVPENIRHLVHNLPRFSAVLTGSRRLKRLREEYWSALYGLGTRLGVTALDQEAAEQLVTRPVRGQLTYTGKALDLCVRLTARQPYLLQCLCNRIFDDASQASRPSVTADVVEKAATEFVEDNEHFASLWDYAGSDRKRLLLVICHQEGEGPDLLRLGVIQERLSSMGVEVEDEVVIKDLDFLRELELVEFHGSKSGGHYELTIPLMGLWIDSQRDVDAVRSRARMESEDSHE